MSFLQWSETTFDADNRKLSFLHCRASPLEPLQPAGQGEPLLVETAAELLRLTIDLRRCRCGWWVRTNEAAAWRGCHRYRPSVICSLTLPSWSVASVTWWPCCLAARRHFSTAYICRNRSNSPFAPQAPSKLSNFTSPVPMSMTAGYSQP